MNTANLQMQGMLLALTALCRELMRKDLLKVGEIAAALDQAEAGASSCESGLSDSNIQAIQFPIRFLRLALEQEHAALDFQALSAEIGRARERPSA